MEIVARFLKHFIRTQSRQDRKENISLKKLGALASLREAFWFLICLD